MIWFLNSFINDYFNNLEEEIFRNRSEKLVLKSLGIRLLVQLLMLYVLKNKK